MYEQNDESFITYAFEYSDDQIWYRIQSGLYYIENVYRITTWGSGDEDTGVHSGSYSDDQLWYVEQQADGYWILTNLIHTARLTKWGVSDEDCGSYDASGPSMNDQLWQLVDAF
jgi:hypothetical protein